MARLVEPISLSKLAQEGVVFQIDPAHINNRDVESEEEDSADIPERKFQNSNKECAGIFDEDTYEEGEPFQIIAKKMFNLVPDGKIKKRIIREGDEDEKPQECATVKINYNGYIEYDDEPFDSTYIRKKPLMFTLNTGKVIAGLDFAVQSMKLNEKSQFLIDPVYAYGKNCMIGRIPADATVLFEIELLKIINSGAAVTFQKLPEDQQKLFPEVYKFCVALNERGKQLVKQQNFKNAIKEYNTAAAKLEKVMLNSKAEAEQHRELALKLYSNLLICYTRNDNFRKGCLNAKKIYDLTENGELMKISAKVYFNHAKCLRRLGEYSDAKVVLDKAYKIEPRNPEIANEMLNLEKDKLEQKEKQMIFAKALVGNADN